MAAADVEKFRVVFDMRDAGVRMSIRSARYNSSRRTHDLRVGKYLIPDYPVQPVLRHQVHLTAEQPLQVILQVEVRHA